MFRLSRRQWRVLVPALLACGLALLAYKGGSHPPVAAAADTLLINSKFSVALPKRLVTPDGGTLSRFFRRYSAGPEAVAVIPHDGAVQCAATGDATVTVASWRGTATVVVLCRPIRSFYPFGGVRLVLGGPPAVPNVGAFGDDRRPVTQLAGTTLVRDTSIARYRDGKLYPVAVGRTRMEMDFSGMRSTLGIEVVENVEAMSLHLAGGELKSWRLPRGRYEILLGPAAPLAVAPQLAMGTYKANCAPGRLGPQHIHCVTYEEGALIVRNLQAPGPRSGRTSDIKIVRQAW